MGFLLSSTFLVLCKCKRHVNVPDKADETRIGTVVDSVVWVNGETRGRASKEPCAEETIRG